MSDRSMMSLLVSPHGFDGAGPVPDEVTAAAKRSAGLRVKFLHQWQPGMESALTAREVEDLFAASALTAEWLREVTEARDVLVAEVERLREALHRLTHVVREPGCPLCGPEQRGADVTTSSQAGRVCLTCRQVLASNTHICPAWSHSDAAGSRGGDMTTEALDQAWRASPEEAAAFDALDAAYIAADAAYQAARDAWMAEHKEEP